MDFEEFHQHSLEWQDVSSQKEKIIIFNNFNVENEIWMAEKLKWDGNSQN